MSRRFRSTSSAPRQEGRVADPSFRLPPKLPALPLDLLQRFDGEAAELDTAQVGRVLENHPHAIALLGEGGQILGVNRVFEELLGVPAGEATGRTLAELPGYLPISSREGPAGATAGATPAQLIGGDRLGARIDLTVRMVDLPPGSSRVASYAIVQEAIGCATEIQTLRESEVRFRSVVEMLGDGVLIMDLEDRITYANARTGEITGYGPEEIFGRIAGELLVLREDAREHELRVARRVLGRGDRYETRYVCKWGGITRVEVRETPLRGSSGRVVGAVAVVSDVTERRCAVDPIVAGTPIR